MGLRRKVSVAEENPEGNVRVLKLGRGRAPGGWLVSALFRKMGRLAIGFVPARRPGSNLHRNSVAEDYLVMHADVP